LPNHERALSIQKEKGKGCKEKMRKNIVPLIQIPKRRITEPLLTYKFHQSINTKKIQQEERGGEKIREREKGASNQMEISDSPYG